MPSRFFRHVSMYYVACGVAVSNTHALMKMLPAPSLFVSQICLDEPVQNIKCLLNIGTSAPSWFTPFGPFFPPQPWSDSHCFQFSGRSFGNIYHFGAYFKLLAHLSNGMLSDCRCSVAFCALSLSRPVTDARPWSHNSHCFQFWGHCFGNVYNFWCLFYIGSSSQAEFPVAFGALPERNQTQK